MADVVVLANPGIDCDELEAELAHLKKRPTIVDVWREFGLERARRREVAYRAVGVGRNEADKLSRLEQIWAGRQSTGTANA